MKSLEQRINTKENRFCYVVIYEPVEKGIRRKLKDGKKFSYEATANFGRVEIYDEELKKFVKKQDKRRKTFKTLAEARKWLHQIELHNAGYTTLKIYKE